MISHQALGSVQQEPWLFGRFSFQSGKKTTHEKSIKLLQLNPFFLFENTFSSSMWRSAPRSFSGSLQCGGKTLILERLVTPTTKGAIAEIAMKGTSPKRLRKTYGYGGPQSQHPHSDPRNSWDL
jgi:hypothetical protein